MNRTILIVMFLLGLVSALPVQAEEESERLWTESVTQAGGQLKAYFLAQPQLVENGLVSDQTVSIFVLTEAALGNAVRNDRVVLEEGESIPSEVWQRLIGRFITLNPLPVDENGMVRWSDFCSYGQPNGGFTPFSQADYDEALRQVSFEQLPTQPVEPEKTPQPEVQPEEVALPVETQSAPPVVVERSAPEVEAPAELVVEEASSQEDASAKPAPAVATPPSQQRRMLSITTVSTGDVVDVLHINRKPAPSDAELDVFLLERERAEREAAEREAAEAAKREAEAAQARAQTMAQATATRGAQAPWWEHKPQHLMDARARWRPPAERRRHHPSPGGSASQQHAEAFLRDYFHDLPVMVEIARCESSFKNIQSNLLYSNGPRRGQQERSFGFFQIHEPNWHALAIELGLDDYQTDAMQNVLLARRLYELEGLKPWRFSKNCWGPNARRLGLL